MPRVGGDPTGRQTPVRQAVYSLHSLWICEAGNRQGQQHLLSGYLRYPKSNTGEGAEGPVVNAGLKACQPIL